MYDFPASVRGAADYTTIIASVGILVLLAVMFWFAVRKPPASSPNRFRVWFLLSTGIVSGQLVGIASFPSPLSCRCGNHE